MSLLEAKKVHVIGIGGVGVSAVAKILSSRGVLVTGSDAEESPLVEDVRAEGILVHVGHDAGNLPADADAIIYSGAVPASNAERVAAQDQNIPQFSYSEALGEISKQYKTIAVSGTHGKSTVTAMLGSILIAAGLDPLVLVGTRVKTLQHGNVHLGQGEWFVVEACEHEAQMMKLSPTYIVVNNLESDHLDFYHSFEKLSETFAEYVKKVAPQNCIVNADESSVRKLFGEQFAQTKSFGFSEFATATKIGARHILDGAQNAEFFVGGEQKILSLRIPGAFNVSNAAAAFTAAVAIGVSPDVALAALDAYPGSWRRFERVGFVNGAPVISDYGHHPTAVNATVQATKEFFPGRRVLLVYQPHQHHRTGSLYPEFVSALAAPDALVLHEIYDVRGRERAEDQSVSSSQLLKDVAAARDGKPHWYAANLTEAADLIRTHALPDDVVVVMGAGDIYKVAHEVCST